MRRPLTPGWDTCFSCGRATLLAQAFDERSLQPQGNPIPVAERVGSLFLSGLFSASPSGVLAYSLDQWRFGFRNSAGLTGRAKS